MIACIDNSGSIRYYEIERPAAEIKNGREENDMALDIKSIGTFGISFSKGLDQTWFNLWRKDFGYSMDLYQNVEDETSDEEDEIIQTIKKITFEEGEAILTKIFEQGHLEEWKDRYAASDEGDDTDLNWTIDVDDIENNDILLLSGNWKLPPNGWMTEVIKAIRTEKDFAKCFKEFP